jgi:hypothetical protein
VSGGGLLSAQVVLRPAAGESAADAELTADAIDRHAPDHDAAQAARGWFEQRGMAVSEVAGNSFSITGDVELFERELGARASSLAEAEGELSTERLPGELRDSIEAITFTPGEALR